MKQHTKIKKLLKPLVIIACTAALLFLGVYIFTRSEPVPTVVERSPPIIINRPIRPSVVLPYIQDGDLILRMSDGSWSRLFADFSMIDKRFSHIGIVRMRDDGISMIHSVGSFGNRLMGVEELSLEHFLAVANAVGVFRVKSVDGTVISDAAMQYIDFPFDFNFDLDDYSTVYCTELLYRALQPAGLQHILSTRFLDDTGTDIIPLEAISNSPDIEEIVYIVRESRQTVQDDQVVLQENPVRTGLLRRLMLLFTRLRQNP